MKKLKPNKTSLLITTGDADGIGFEVTAKALSKLPSLFFKSTNACIFISEKFEKRYLRLLNRKFSITTLKKPSSSFSLSDLDCTDSKSKRPELFLVIAPDSPADWIYSLSKIALANPTHAALVTAPLSKTLIKDAGYSAIGHTEILSEISGVKSLYMGFAGKYFNVVLLTGHIPLSQVSSAIKLIDWSNVSKVAKQFLSALPNPKKPIGLLGVNPHAGEKGMISSGEEVLLEKQITALGKDLDITGPLVPDAAFLKANWKKYGLYLCCYHDQGLIPFKAIHGQDSGVHVTLGLPFVRTSVDHGTAKEIYGKNKANPNSMKEALVLAKTLLSAQA